MGLLSVVYKCFDKSTSGSGITNENMSDQQLAEKLHKRIFKIFKKSAITFYRQYLRCWSCWYAILIALISADLIKEFVFCYVIDFFSKYLLLWKIKEALQLLMLFKKS